MEKDVEQAQSGQTEIEEEVGLNSKAKALSEQRFDFNSFHPSFNFLLVVMQEE